MSANKRFSLFLGSLTGLRLLYAIFLPLAPQEAYYWNYSRHPALSYFDHPPMAAYFIKLATILGVSAFSIHLAAIVISIPLTIGIYRLATMLFDEWVGFWSAAIINITFIYALGSLIITPDSPMLLFWVLIMMACFKIDRGEGKFWWVLLGIFLGAGFTSKYTIIFAGLGCLIFFMSSRQRIKSFATFWPYVAIAAAFIMALPVIYWNYSHNWASFAFQTSRRAGEMTRFRGDYFFGFIGTVIAIYGVLPFPLLFAGMRSAVREAFRSMSSAHFLIISFSLPLVLFLLPVSAISWVKMNWTAPAFIGWFIAAVAYYRSHQAGKKWVRVWGKISLIFLLAVFILSHAAVVLANFYMGKGDYFSGWEQLADKVEGIRKDMPEPYFISGTDYKIPSQMAFYLSDHPETVGSNVVGQNGLQYYYWCNPDTLKGYNAIYIFEAGSKGIGFDETLRQYFGNVSRPELFDLERGGHSIRKYFIYRCYNYLGMRN